MNTEHLKKIDNVLKELVDTGFAAGSGVMVLKDGEEVFFTSAGYRDIENKLPIEKDTIFRLYSMTKPITATAAWMLIEDGVFELDTPVATYIESFKNQVVAEGWNRIPVKRPVRIKDLLNMSAGLCYNGILNQVECVTCGLVDEGIARIGTDNEMSTVEFAEKIGKLPLMFQPGEGYNYSFCADVLGAVIEKASGMKFGEFLKTRIFDPLGMEDTGFFVPKDKQNRLTKVYENTGEGLKEYNYNNLIINLKMDHAPGFESGGAGLATTLQDYARFATMLMNGGIYKGVRIMQKRTIDCMTNASAEKLPREMRIRDNGYDGTEYVNLLQITKDASSYLTIASDGEYGWDGWLGPYFRNDPAHKVTMLMGLQLTNAGTTTYTRRVRNVVFSSVEND